MSANKDNLEILRKTMQEALSNLNNQSTLKIGRETIRSLLKENVENERRINFILMMILQNLNMIKEGEKVENIKILSLVSDTLPELQRYLSKILTIFQMLINEGNMNIIPIVLETLSEIISKLYLLNKDNIDTSLMNFDLLLGFCLYNIKEDKKINQVCGCQCLIILTQKSFQIINESFIKKILDTIIPLFENTLYSVKFELLECLINLIYASVGKFIPYSTVTLFKVLDFLKNDDPKIRKIAIDIIYTISLQCPDEIFPIKQNIIDFLQVVKSDEVKEVRDICLSTINYLNGNEETKELTLETTKEFGDVLRKSFKLSNKVLIEEKVEKESVPIISSPPKEKVDDPNDFNGCNSEDKNIKIEQEKIESILEKEICLNRNKENSRNHIIKPSCLTTFRSDKNTTNTSKDKYVTYKTKYNSSYRFSTKRSKNEENVSNYKTHRNKAFNQDSCIIKIQIDIQIFFKEKKEVKEHSPLPQVHTLNIKPRKTYDPFICQDIYSNKINLKDKENITKSNIHVNSQMDIYKQIKNLSEKQIILIETIINEQKRFKDEIDNVNENVIRIENNLNQHINNFNFKRNTENYTSISDTMNQNQCCTLSHKNKSNLIEKEICDYRENTPMNNKLEITTFLIELESMSKYNFDKELSEIKKFPITFKEEIISKLLIFLTNSKYVHKVIPIIKSLLINIENKYIRQSVINSLLSTLKFIKEKKDYFHLNEGDISEIGLIVGIIEEIWKK